jgi:hypothetical protein
MLLKFINQKVVTISIVILLLGLIHWINKPTEFISPLIAIFTSLGFFLRYAILKAETEEVYYFNIPLNNLLKYTSQVLLLLSLGLSIFWILN